VRYPGESAFAAVGRTAKFDATQGDYPQDNTIEYNHLHELGIHTKQTAGYFQSQAAHNHVTGNAIYNGPRSGVNWNDGTRPSASRPGPPRTCFLGNILYGTKNSREQNPSARYHSSGAGIGEMEEVAVDSITLCAVGATLRCVQLCTVVHVAACS
jgi:hypothetical protein